MIRALPLAVALLALPACATVRMHSETELAEVGRVCGLAAGELIQDEEEPKILLLLGPGATPAERLCAARWARRNNLHLAFVEGIDFKEQ